MEVQTGVIVLKVLGIICIIFLSLILGCIGSIVGFFVGAFAIPGSIMDGRISSVTDIFTGGNNDYL